MPGVRTSTNDFGGHTSTHKRVAVYLSVKGPRYPLLIVIGTSRGLATGGPPVPRGQRSQKWGMCGRGGMREEGDVFLHSFKTGSGSNSLTSRIEGVGVR